MGSVGAVRISFLILLILSTLSSAAQAEEGPSGYWSVQLENDVFANSGDRYYTHGTQISYLHEIVPDSGLIDTAEILPFYQRGPVTNAVNHTLGQKIFTPNDIKSTELVEDDRPYAGYLYYNLSLLSRVTRNSFYDYGNIVGLTIGVVGPSAGAEQVQGWYHDTIGIDTPAGWEHQLDDEPVLGISYSRIWSIVMPTTGPFEFGVSPHVTGVLGNAYTYAAGGVMFRFGTHLRGDLSPPNISPGFPGASFFDTANSSNWYFFAGHESRMMARNIFLDGNTFSDSHSVRKELLVGDYQFGFAVHAGSWRIAISNMIRTKEYDTQDKNTQYGAVNLSMAL